MSSARASTEPARVRAMVRDFHAGAEAIAEADIERALKLEPGAEDRRCSLPAMLRRFGNQNFDCGGTPFRDLREMFRVLPLRKTDLFCDAGAGYGRAVFYGACVAPCRFRAVEVLPVRCAALRRSARRLKIGNVEIVEGDALAQRYDDVSYLYLCNPFFPDAARRFIADLKAPRRRLTVIAAYNIVAQFRADSDFREIDCAADIAPYRFGMFSLAGQR